MEASPKEKFDTLFGLLKDHYTGLFDFQFKNVTVLTFLLGWTLASHDARDFLHSHREILAALPDRASATRSQRIDDFHTCPSGRFLFYGTIFARVPGVVPWR